MKMHVIYDKQGNIISAAASIPPSIDIQAPRFGPERKGDQLVAELEVPEEVTKMAPADLASRLHELVQVDTKSKPHKLVIKGK